MLDMALSNYNVLSHLVPFTIISNLSFSLVCGFFFFFCIFVFYVVQIFSVRSHLDNLGIESRMQNLPLYLNSNPSCRRIVSSSHSKFPFTPSSDWLLFVIRNL